MTELEKVLKEKHYLEAELKQVKKELDDLADQYNSQLKRQVAYIAEKVDCYLDSQIKYMAEYGDTMAGLLKKYREETPAQEIVKLALSYNSDKNQVNID